MLKGIVVVWDGTHAKVLPLSGAYLVALLLVGWGLALDPWVKPDVDVRRGHPVCRALWGSETEIKVFERYALGLERLQVDYLIDDATQSCHYF